MSRFFLHRLSTKLVLTMNVLLVFTITFISLIYYWNSRNVIANHVRESSRQSAKQTADYMSLILTVGIDMGQQISRDASIQKVIQDEAKEDLSIDQKYGIKETVDQLLNNVMYTNTFVRSIYLLKEEGDSWGSGLFNISKVRRYTLNETAWYSDIVNNRVDDTWLQLQYDPFSGGGENTDLVLTYVKPLRDIQKRETIGAIVVNLNGQVILQAIERISLGKTGKFFIINNAGDIMIDSDPSIYSQDLLVSPQWQNVNLAQQTELEFEWDINDDRYYVVTQKMENDWMIIGIVPVIEIISDIQNIQRQIWMYATFFLLISSIVGWLFSRRITSPLKRLMNQMTQISKSNFEALTEVTSQDEVGQLSRKYNQMIHQIEVLIEQVNEVESKKREAEMRALRHQINPHFLYNTLSTIRWMVKFKHDEKAYHAIAALVQLMEASMEKKGPFITIQDEIDLLEKYMVIQKFRYGSHIELKIICDERCYDYKIPRMLLQPLVENAIFHGMAPKEAAGEIQVSISLVEGVKPRIFIQIEDDGVGIPAQMIPGLLKPTSKRQSGIMYGIGLNHVHETIQLYYGAKSGVNIQSIPNQGTVISLELEIREDEADAI